jgi:hypothetical protein
MSYSPDFKLNFKPDVVQLVDEIAQKAQIRLLQQLLQDGCKLAIPECLQNASKARR